MVRGRIAGQRQERGGEGGEIGYGPRNFKSAEEKPLSCGFVNRRSCVQIAFSALVSHVAHSPASPPRTTRGPVHSARFRGTFHPMARARARSRRRSRALQYLGGGLFAVGAAGYTIAKDTRARAAQGLPIDPPIVPTAIGALGAFCVVKGLSLLGV